jgi:hypothetical protein
MQYEVRSMKLPSPRLGRGLNMAHNECFFAHACTSHVPIFFHFSSFTLQTYLAIKRCAMSQYLDSDKDVIPGRVELGGGVQFWAIVSLHNVACS